jgi:hypothetical protein
MRPDFHWPPIRTGLLMLVWILPTAASAHMPETADTVLAAAHHAETQDHNVTAGYKNGFFIQNPDGTFVLKMQTRVQARYAYDAYEGFGQGEDDGSTFSIPRARLTLGGRALDPDLKYKFQIDFGGGNGSLKDFYGDYVFLPGLLHLRVGQWKRPFSRQQINSSGRLEFVDRAVTDKAFGAGRDIGLALHNNYEKSPTFEWALGLFNGTGVKSNLSGSVVVDENGDGTITGGKFSNVPDRFAPTVVGRIGYNHGGIKGYREADLEGGALRFAIAAGALTEFGDEGYGASQLRSQVDYALKLHGFASTGGAYMANDLIHTNDGTPTLSKIGFHLQTGYLIGERIQPGLRYSQVDDKEIDETKREATAGLSVYFFQHRLKWQTDGGALISETSEGDKTDYRVRTQLQMAF